jgi:hypothetical protein
VFDFYRYIEVFNAGDDRAMVGQFWTDQLEVFSGRGDQAVLLWLKFLAQAHDGVREIMRVQTLIQNESNIFAEIDMDFYAAEEKPDYRFGHLRRGDLVTVKMFCLYSLAGDKISKLKMASWAPNAGVSRPPQRNFGPLPPMPQFAR